MRIKDLRIKLFADGADKAEMLAMYSKPFIKGFTTNPSLMRKAGVQNYREFAREIVECIPDRPICFEVLSDDFDEMKRQALEIAGWGKNVYVKIPVSNTRGESTFECIEYLAKAGVRINVTAVLTLNQVKEIGPLLSNGKSCFVSIFAGRIADTGRDPVPIIEAALDFLRPYTHIELIWASTRELFNVFQAEAIGCHIITVTYDVLNKLLLVGRDLDEYTIDTVRMFYNDAVQAGYNL